MYPSSTLLLGFSSSYLAVCSCIRGLWTRAAPTTMDDSGRNPPQTDQSWELSEEEEEEEEEDDDDEFVITEYCFRLSVLRLILLYFVLFFDLARNSFL